MGAELNQKENWVIATDMEAEKQNRNKCNYRG